MKGTGKNWRQLCAAAAVELDSKKLVALVDQILRAFEEGEREGIISNPKNLPVVRVQS
jgi:hypothetical protein